VQALPAGPVTIERRLRYRAPLDTQALLDFFAMRAVPGVEELAGGAYRRSLRLPHGGGVAELRPAGAYVHCTLWLDDERDEVAAVERCRHLFDLDTDPAPIDEHLGRDPLIGELVQASPGRRVPGCADPEEIVIRAVLGQQVSVTGAATLAGRLARDHGEPLKRPVGTVTHLFPTLDALAAAELPMPKTRQAALRGLADAELTPAAMLAVPGVGPWTVAYFELRALKDRDAFLPSDLGVKRALERLGADLAAAEAWRPFRAYALQHLWQPGRPAR
jgi:AraC family transcriptional regulator, regulatory protein of adaptative response / DNA-3-methyladenine glycosylase II